MSKQKTDEKPIKLKLGMIILPVQFAKVKGCSKQTIYNAINKGWLDVSIERSMNNLRVIICTQRTIDWQPGKTIPRDVSKLKMRRLKKGELTSGD